MLGDEGSGILSSYRESYNIYLAYWISHRAIKLVYDVEDGLRSIPSDITILKEAVTTFFNVSARLND